jgi:hypothetical protein
MGIVDTTKSWSHYMNNKFFLNIEYEALAYQIMFFGLMCAPNTFQKDMMRIFAKYLDKFMKVFLTYFHHIWNQKSSFSISRKMHDHMPREWSSFEPKMMIFVSIEGDS